MAETRESEIFINRELSWLEFNRRVMDLSKEKSVPLGEQMNFASIYVSNLDEFFMIRVGSLCDQTLLKNDVRENKTGMTPQQQLDAIMPVVDGLQKSLDKNVAKLYKRLEAEGLHKVDFSQLDKTQLNFWKKYFMAELFPVLSPQIVDRRHPFPFLRNTEIYVGALIRERKSEPPVLGLIPISSQFERLLVVNNEGVTSFALVEELALHFAGTAFGKSSALLEKCLFRVTRNADINVEEGMFDHDIDYREVMSELLKKRRKLSAVRLQLSEGASDNLKSFLLEKLELAESHCFTQKSPMDLCFFGKLRKRLEAKHNPALFYPSARPLPVPSRFDLYKEVRRRDVLVCYPYQSMRPFIRMLYAAGNDPDVISIKMTLYRLADDSKVIEALAAAAENGKEVVTIVELRARFDEQNNIDWSRRLEQAGCTVIYGFSDYKVHSKLTLITRKNGAKFEYISQVGTGNYNEKTSELYTDLSFLTADPDVGEEVGAVFNNLAMERLTDHVNHLIVAPLRFKSVLLEEIHREMQAVAEGREARIILKCNSISDKTVIETLSEASIAGVPIDMIVRGICCLQAGLPGLTENIQVRSLVGRYLEHSRIYAFGTRQNLRVYIASGDFLTRNTERRVEVGIKIEDESIKRVLWDILDMQLRDNVNASLMQPDGSYARVKPADRQSKMDSQMALYPYLQKRQAAQPAQKREQSARATRANTAREAARPEGRRTLAERIKRVFGR